ncbi:hypothetical protein GCM10010431_55480 [Streptomyces kunmingensis]
MPKARRGERPALLERFIEVAAEAERSAEQPGAALRQALAAGEPVSDEIIDNLILPLVDEAAPEWQTALGRPAGPARTAWPRRLLGRRDLHRGPARGA